MAVVPLATDTIGEAVRIQYSLAKKRRRKAWFREMRQNCRCNFNDACIEENVSSLDGSKLPNPKKSSAEATVSETCLMNPR